jgi:mannosyl-3-phosphoglycerate phosphatase
MTPRYLVFTDLDGTLLDHETYAWEPACPAIERLIQHEIPWVFVTSKTRAETEIWRSRTGNRHPFIVENGGAAFVPAGYFRTPVPGASRRDGYEVLEWGTSYPSLIAGLRAASEDSGCAIRGFHDMSAKEISGLCGLPHDMAELAKRREYDEPFIVLDDDGTENLVQTIESRGLRCARGGHFWHITGDNDKGIAAHALQKLYELDCGPMITIGLGDASNDLPFLRQAAIPVIIGPERSGELCGQIPQAMVTENRGPAGWAEALLKIVS